MMKFIRRSLRLLLALFIVLNIIAAFHAYRFTHFYEDQQQRIQKPENMSRASKLTLMVFGMKYPKSKNRTTPATLSETVVLHTADDLKLEAWLCNQAQSKGTVILFHGHGSSKSSVIDEAEYFFSLGFNTLLLDFRAHGNSEGNTSTVGYKEAEDVKLAVELMKSRGEKNIILWGRSLGAATIARAVGENKVPANKIILEMSFGTVQEAVEARVRLTGLPAQPFAGLLTFWGGVEQGFWPFSHNPSDYAKKITCPTLVHHAAHDARVSYSETESIYKNLQAADKRLVIYETAGHESLLKKEPAKWKASISSFLAN